MRRYRKVWNCSGKVSISAKKSKCSENSCEKVDKSFRSFAPVTHSGCDKRVQQQHSATNNAGDENVGAKTYRLSTFTIVKLAKQKFSTGKLKKYPWRCLKSRFPSSLCTVSVWHTTIGYLFMTISCFFFLLAPTFFHSVVCVVDKERWVAGVGSELVKVSIPRGSSCPFFTQQQAENNKHKHTHIYV